MKKNLFAIRLDLASGAREAEGVRIRKTLPGSDLKEDVPLVLSLTQNIFWGAKAEATGWGQNLYANSVPSMQ
jgi:hypothetical protein